MVTRGKMPAMISGRSPSKPDLFATPIPHELNEFLREIEIFTSGCEVCELAVSQVRRMTRKNGRVTVRLLGAPGTHERAQTLGISQFPAVVLDGEVVTASGTCLHGGD